MPIDQPSSGHAIELTSREITARILSVRGSQVLLDSHLAELYQVETKALNRAVKRNAARFPEYFFFDLPLKSGSLFGKITPRILPNL